MTVSQSTVLARSDEAEAAYGVARPPSLARPFLRHGALLSVGALSWAAAITVIGLDPQTPAGEAGFSLASGLFQLGVLALLRVLWRTQALGEGRVARAAIRVETVLLSLAICSTIVDGIGVSDLTKPGWLLLDMFWPLSMLGMFCIGLRIAIAGRWHGVRRCWPIVAESWAVVTVPSMMIFGPAVGQVVGALHLVLGYAVLGLLVATKRAQD